MAVTPRFEPETASKLRQRIINDPLATKLAALERRCRTEALKRVFLSRVVHDKRTAGQKLIDKQIAEANQIGGSTGGWRLLPVDFSRKRKL